MTGDMLASARQSAAHAYVTNPFAGPGDAGPSIGKRPLQKGGTMSSGELSIDDVAKPDFSPKKEKIELIPAAYQKDKNGIFHIVWKESKNGELEKILIPLSYTPFEITQRLENPDTKEVFFEISIDSKKINIPGSDLANKKGVLMLAGYGVNTVESNAKELCKYIMEYRNLNPIPEALIYDRMGWKDDGSFVLGNCKYGKDDEKPVKIAKATKQSEAIRQAGTLGGWVKAVSLLMKHDAQRFKMYNATIPPLLKPLNEANHSLIDSGDTSTGKTLTTQACMSLYGEPYDLTHAGESTKVGMERTITLFCDLPVNLDDVQNIDKKLLDSIIYMMANGIGKIRGAKAGGLQEVFTWRTVGLLTSETPIVTESSKGGLAMRLVEVTKGLGCTDTASVNLFETEIKSNYGTFAPVLIKYIVTHRDEIIKMHTESLRTLNMIKGKYAFDPVIQGMAGRLANTYATILTAGKVFERLYKDIGGESRDPEPIVTAVFERTLKNKGAETYTNRGLGHILSWIAANRSNFLENGNREHTSDGTTLRYKVYGNITSTHYYVLPSELRAEIERAKFSLERLIQDFTEAGYLETDKDKNQKRGQKTIRMDGAVTKTYAFIREKVDNKDPDSEIGGKP